MLSTLSGPSADLEALKLTSVKDSEEVQGAASVPAMGLRPPWARASHNKKRVSRHFNPDQPYETCQCGKENQSLTPIGRGSQDRYRKWMGDHLTPGKSTPANKAKGKGVPCEYAREYARAWKAALHG